MRPNLEDSAAMSTSPGLEQVTTPALLLDRDKLTANLARGAARAAAGGFRLRPHLKTAKCIEVAELAAQGRDGPITVSTLGEAEYFFDAGFRDIFYAVPISPAKFPRAAALLDGGASLSVLADTADAALLIARCGLRLPTFLEVDTDGHRGGMKPKDPRLLDTARQLHDANCFAGLMAHAGGSYSGRSENEAQRHAAMEREQILLAADLLRAADIPVPVITIGSTPTMLFGSHYEGIDEVRAGVYMFHDLVMAGVGMCQYDEIAISVLATVIGHQAEQGKVFIDAGWMALSRDRGTAAHPVDQYYGLVTGLDGTPIADLVVKDAFQEHGIVASRSGGPIPISDLPVGARVRILPNHACATSAQHESYIVLSGGQPVGRWSRMRGW